jgi:hypothetical protein
MIEDFGQAGAEIKITEDMVSAGAFTLECSELADWEEQAIRVFQAMVRASPGFAEMSRRSNQESI